MIHPMAVVEPDAVLHADVEVAPYAYVGHGVVLHAGVRIGMNAFVERDTEIGEGSILFPGVCVGTEPQDLSYKGEKTRVEIGKNTTLREYVTVNRASAKENYLTKIGDNCYLMAYSHVAHDCELGDGVIMANNTSLSGHVHVGDHAFISGLVGVHQFVRIGKHAMVAALSRVGRDVPAYCTVFNDDIMGLNIVGLRRHKISAEVRAELKKALAIFTDKNLLADEARMKLAELAQYPEIEAFRASVEKSKRGVVRNS
jgi:UDP-N-acetylglucosamine acyltransferase